MSGRILKLEIVLTCSSSSSATEKKAEWWSFHLRQNSSATILFWNKALLLVTWLAEWNRERTIWWDDMNQQVIIWRANIGLVNIEGIREISENSQFKDLYSCGNRLSCAAKLVKGRLYSIFGGKIGVMYKWLEIFYDQPFWPGLPWKFEDFPHSF